MSRYRSEEDLRRQVAGHLVDVVRQVLPRARHDNPVTAMADVYPFGGTMWEGLKVRATYTKYCSKSLKGTGISIRFT